MEATATAPVEASNAPPLAADWFGGCWTARTWVSLFHSIFCTKRGTARRGHT